MKSFHIIFFTALLSCVARLTTADAGVPLKDQLEGASAKGDMAAIQMLISKGADLNAESTSGWTPLMHAGYNGNFELVKWLIEKGADPNHISSYDKYTALHWTASQNRVEIVKYLISKGADVKKADAATPLLLIAYSRDPEIAKVFIANGADVNGCDQFESCVLICASECQGLDITLLLIDHGAKIDIQGSGCTKWGHKMKNVTPLMRAAQRGNLELVEFLVKKGADIKLKDAEGKSALSYAQEFREQKVIDYLVSLGAP